MKNTRKAFVIGLAALSILSAQAADQSPAVKKDLALLQGTWTMVSGKADGQPMPEEMAKEMRRVCKEDVLTVMMADQVFMKAKIAIDPSKTPKTIDYQMIEGDTKGKTNRGIYELEGDTLKSCFAGPDAERPTDFSSKPGDHRTFSVWKRQKPKTPTPDQKQ